MGCWAVWTIPCGLAALGALGLAVWPGVAGHRALAAILAALAVPPFVLAALVAGRLWSRLLNELELERDHTLDIAAGLPVVTTAGVLGAAIALLTAAVLLFGRR